jgi:cytochrome c-type biogenesis protein CcmH/NrfG
MSTKAKTVKQSTMFLAMALSLVLGFIGGVAFTVYMTPDVPGGSASRDQEVELQTAIAGLEQEALAHPDNAETWNQLGHLYFDTNNYKKAITAYTTSLRLVPDDLNIMTDLGVMYRRNKDPEQAAATFRKVLSLDAGHEQARFNLGVVLLNDLHDKPAALDQWRKLVDINPQATTPSGTLVSDLINEIAKEK